MESAKIFTPLAQALAIFCFLSEPNIPEGPEYEKNINTISMYRENFQNYSHKNLGSVVDPR